jgi:TctA family transporter
MIRYGWPRAPLVLGFVLGKLAETYLFISMARYGYGWLTQPLVLVLMALTALVIVFPYFQERRVRAN